MEFNNLKFQWEVTSELFTEDLMSNNTDATAVSSKDIDAAAKYLTGTSRFFIFAPLRILIAVIGIVGNVLTLKIIKNLKVRSNGHVLMMYLAVSDISMSLVSPVVLYKTAEETIIESGPHWKELCIIKDYLDVSTSMLCITSYTLLSVDR